MTHHDRDGDGALEARLLRETLLERAADADSPLPVRPPLPARRPGRLLTAAAAAAATVLAVGGVAAWRAERPMTAAGPAISPAPTSTAPATPTAAPPVGVPAGWKPVASLGIEIHVPPSWEVTGAVNPCTLKESTAGTVSRPVGAVVAIGCERPPPATLVSFEQVYDRAPAPGRATEDGRTTITWIGPDGTSAVVASGPDAALLQQVVDTARRVDVDSLGCGTRPPVLAWDRPRAGLPPVRLPGDVTEIVGCHYTVTGEPSGQSPEYRLVASAGFDEAQRAALATALRRAPAGTTPDVPQDCGPGRPETEYTVLHVRSATGVATLAMHPQGCAGPYVAGEASRSTVTVRVLTVVMDTIGIGYSYGSELPQG